MDEVKVVLVSFKLEDDSEDGMVRAITTTRDSQGIDFDSQEPICYQSTVLQEIILKALKRLIFCRLLNQHYYKTTCYKRWESTGENWVCLRCGKAIKSVKELYGTKGKLKF